MTLLLQLLLLLLHCKGRVGFHQIPIMVVMQLAVMQLLLLLLSSLLLLLLQLLWLLSLLQ